MDSRNDPVDPLVGFDVPRWGFIGAGKMAGAMIRGMIRHGQPAGSIAASDRDPATRAGLVGETGIHSFATNAEVIARSEVVVLAVKPQVLPAVLAEIRPELTSRHLVISIAAGVTLDTLTRGLGEGRRVVRVMPNTPAVVGEGAAGYCMGPGTTDADEATVRDGLEAVGKAFRVAEPLLDAVTGVSGSGPAFACLIIEALSDGGVLVGLPRDLATTLAAQTLLGTAKMVLETGLHPGALKDQVASPAGTTIAGLHALERGGLRGALIDAVRAAYDRSIELAARAAAEPPR